MSTVALLEQPTVMRENGEALYEIVNGELLELPAMSILAAMIASLLQEDLGVFVRKQKLGRVVTEGLFILDQKKNIRRRPDVAFVSAERWALDRSIPASGDWPVVPDAAVEVISPNDLMVKVLEKVREYFTYQVKQVWLIVPDERVIYIYDSVTTVRGLSFDQELSTPLLPGFRLKLAELVQPALP